MRLPALTTTLCEWIDLISFMIVNVSNRLQHLVRRSLQALHRATDATAAHLPRAPVCRGRSGRSPLCPRRFSAGPNERAAVRCSGLFGRRNARSEEHTSELQSPCNIVCRLLLEKKKYTQFRGVEVSKMVG